jgi:imidazolonepropionase-like amidohydrolase
MLKLILALATMSPQQDTTIVLRGATIYTAAGAPIPNGTIVLRGGKIAAVGASVPVPAGARVIDVTGKVITPGMLDEHSHIGAKPTDLNDYPMVIGPQNRIIDALDLEDPDWKTAVSGGVTTVITGPGSGENISGQAIVIKTFGDDLATRIVREKGGVKWAMGPKS